MALDLTDTRRYLQALSGLRDASFCWQTYDDKKSAKERELASIRHGTLDDLTVGLLALNAAGAGIYICVNLTDGKGRKLANVTALRALFIDCDGTAPLPSTWALEPTIVVQRDETHWHAYWVLKPGEDLARFKAAQVQLAIHFQTDLTINDLTRVMRVPGFYHHKGEPVMVRLVRAGAETFSIEQLLGAYPLGRAALQGPSLRAAELAGLVEPAKRAAPAAAAAPRPAATGKLTDMQRYDRMFEAWANRMETTSGAANPAGGRDNMAFKIAIEGYGRVNDGRLSGEGVVEQVVEAYLQRAQWEGDLAEAVTRICRSARGRGAKGNAPDIERLSASRTMTRSPSADEDLFGGAAAAKPAVPAAAAAPPAPPAPPTAPPATPPPPPPPEDPKYGGLDLALLQMRWSLGPWGVVPMERSTAGELNPKPNRRVAGLPIWPERAGSDVATGATYWELAWLTPTGQTKRQWLAESAMKSGHSLVELPDGPVARRSAEMCGVYLTEARSAVRQEPCQVTSRIGWCGVNGSRRWVWPGVGDTNEVSYIGGELPAHGSLEGWRVGIDHVLSLPGDLGFTALAVIALSVASPWSRLQGARNPIIGLMASSSSGKGSCIDYALAAWADPDLFRVPASSTSKGIQDSAIRFPDTPVSLDELQQLAEYDQRHAADALYFLANGQRRLTSSKEQKSVGGERRFGVGYYAAEAPVLPGMNLGVHYRVIELDGKPCPDEFTSKRLQAGTRHSGTMAGPIAELITSRPVVEWIADLKDRTDRLRADHDKLLGDDAEALALIELGLETLGRILGVPKLLAHLEAETAEFKLTSHLVAWLARRIEGQRCSVVDRETLALHQVMSCVLNQRWIYVPEDQPTAQPFRKREIIIQGRPMAWRKWPEDGHTAQLDCDPLHRELAGVFTAFGGEPRLLRSWADRGWIERQGAHLKVKRANGGRVVRFTQLAWEAFGETPAAPMAPVSPDEDGETSH